jgi:WD40 repeat protein
MFQCLHTFNENLSEYLNSLSINLDRSLLAACFHDSVKVWDLKIGEIVHKINLSGDQYGHTNTLVSPDWRTIISDDRYGNLRIYDFWTGCEIKSIQSSSSALAFTPDGKFLFEGICKPPFTKDGEIEVHITDVLTGQLHCVLPFLKGYLPIRSLLVSPDGNILVVQASHLLTQVWDWQNRQCLQAFNALPSSSPLSSSNPVCRHWIDAVATCPNGRIIAAVAQRDKSIEGTTNAIWDM